MAWEPGEVRFFEKISVPTVNDDENDGYRVSDIWLNLTGETSFRCLDSSVGAAVWKKNLSEVEGDPDPSLAGDLGCGGYNVDNVGKFCGCSLATTICNDTGATLVQGTAVTIHGLTEEKCCVCVSDNREKTKMPACVIVEADIADGENGCGIFLGRVKMDTSGMTGVAKDRLYVQNDGSLDTVIPSSGMVQRVGILTVKAAGNAGRICVSPRGPRSMYSAKDEYPIIRMGDTGYEKISFRSYDDTEIVELTSTVLDMKTHKIVGIVDPVDNQDAATKKFTIDNFGSKTSAAWSKSIGSGGDYATWAAMIADMPDLIAHEVMVTIKAGTTLTETCDLKNKHGLTSAAKIVVKSEKYFPTSGVLPTADSATATTLRDATLATTALGDDYFNGCWVFIVDGTGTDNGFVPITDYIDANGDVVVASWPGTQPDATSRYLIVGALINCGGILTAGLKFFDTSVNFLCCGLGVYDSAWFGFFVQGCKSGSFNYCGAYNCDREGFYAKYTPYMYTRYCGAVKCNTDNSSSGSGIRADLMSHVYVRDCGISDNNQRGIFSTDLSYIYSLNNFGDGNGAWGAYAFSAAQIRIVGTECSGSSGKHSDPGTAGTANADQASAY